MKIKRFAMAMAVCGMMLTACGNSNKAAEDSSATEVVAVSEEVVNAEDDSTAEEVVAEGEVVTRGGEHSDGFGRCSKCTCKAFEGRGDNCKNCGHAYKAHYQ